MVNSLRCLGRNEIDAVKMIGAHQLKESRSMLVQASSLRVAYVPPTLSAVSSGASLGYRFTDSIGYKIISCRSGAVLSQGVQNLKVTLGSSNIEDVSAPTWMVSLSMTVAIIGMVVSVASVGGIFRYAKEPIVRAASTFFMNLMLLGTFAGFVVILMMAVHAADPTVILSFCMTRQLVFSLAFILLIGSIIVKTGRIVFIFEMSANAQGLSLTNMKLAGALAFLYLFDLLIHVGAIIFDPLTDTVVISGSGSRYHVCAEPRL